MLRESIMTSSKTFHLFAWFFICWLQVLTLAANETDTIISTNTIDTHSILKAPSIAKHEHYKTKCGNLTIPYPFGIGKDCALDPGFKIICNTAFNPPTAFVENIPVYDISDTQLRVQTAIGRRCYDSSGALTYDDDRAGNTDLGKRPFSFSDANRLFVISCGATGYIGAANWNSYTGCVSSCSQVDDVINGSCSGIGCCQVSIPKLPRYYQITFDSWYYNRTNVYWFNPCSYALLGEQNRYKFGGAKDLNGTLFLNRTLASVPIVLDWAIGNLSCEEAKKKPDGYACKAHSYCVDSNTGLGGYRCRCNEGFKGNPYLDPGCQDIDECADHPKNPCVMICKNHLGGYNCSCPDGYYGDGKKNGQGCIREISEFPVIKVFIGIELSILSLVTLVSWLYFTIQKRKLNKMREIFFLQNGGLLLKQQISSNDGGGESRKLFTAEELEKATNNYAEDRIVGQGGYGIVYKGILLDKWVVAIKKSKMMDKSQIEQFINEVFILTQVNHRNVVKLLECCLEVEVPLLVYEYISNGTLFYHIHNSGTSWLSGENRLRIAAETAGALAYLHSQASKPIIHRDVKSKNILLDDGYIAKISDFGASRLVALDQTQVTTLVQGTLGYLDPEYFRTSQLTDKSDVYSFGVVLAEMLTGKKHLCMERSLEERHLTTYLVMSMKENRLFQCLDARVVRERSLEQVQAVAQLVKRCTHVNNEDRPTMKEVAMELEGLKKFNKHSWTQSQGNNETVGLIAENEARDLYGGTEASDLYTVELSTYTNVSNTSRQHSLELDTTPILFPTNTAR